MTCIGIVVGLLRRKGGVHYNQRVCFIYFLLRFLISFVKIDYHYHSETIKTVASKQISYSIQPSRCIGFFQHRFTPSKLSLCYVLHFTMTHSSFPIKKKAQRHETITSFPGAIVSQRVRKHELSYLK